MTVGVVYWQESIGISDALSETITKAGHRAVKQTAYNPLRPGLDLVLACGPFGSLAPLGRQLLAVPALQRPDLVLWLTEQLPAPTVPEPVQYLLGGLRSWAERNAYHNPAGQAWQPRPGWRWLSGKAQRLRYYGDLHWLRRSGLLSLLVVASPPISAWLRAHGFEPLKAVLGVHPSWGEDLGLERDVPALWLGKPGSRRRSRLLSRLRSDLRRRGVELMVVDGVEHPYVFGDERTVLLNRTRIVVNLLREKWDNNGMRFFLAAANRAMVIGEPSLAHTPFVPGTHLVEAPIDHLASAICHYLANETERQRIAEQGHRLATEEHTMASGVGKVLARAARARQQRLARLVNG